MPCNKNRRYNKKDLANIHPSRPNNLSQWPPFKYLIFASHTEFTQKIEKKREIVIGNFIRGEWVPFKVSPSFWLRREALKAERIGTAVNDAKR